MPRILVEDDRVLRLIGVVLDPDTAPERRAAWADFVAHDEPDFSGWLQATRRGLGSLHPSEVVFAGDADEFRRRLPDADAVVIEGLAFGRDELALGKGVKLVQKFGAITTNIDGAACANRGLPVETLRRRQNIAVAEHAFMLMLALARRLAETGNIVTEGALAAAGFDPRPFDSRFMSNSNFGRVPGLKTLAGSTVGVVGMGEIGREFAARCGAFGMHVIYHQRTALPPAEEARLNAAQVPLPALFAQADAVSIHLPLNDSTRGLVDAQVLSRAKPGLLLINTARAHIIERDALIAALDAGRLGGFALDTGYAEPAEPDDPLLGRPNVLLTPHTAPAARRNGLDDIADICRNLKHALCA